MSGSYTVVAGDTVSEIAEKFNLKTEDLLRWNGLQASDLIHPGQELELSGHEPAEPDAPTERKHTVAPGDTLSEIGQQYGIPWRSIAEANGLTDPYVIKPGQELTIPIATVL